MSSSDGHQAPLVGVVMGSTSDWETMKPATEILRDLGIRFEERVVSAHRTPKRLSEYAEQAHERGIRVVIAGAGGAAHLPGMLASEIHPSIPVLGVPVKSSALNGLDSLLSIVQMPGGVPVATFSIGPAGAKNAALTAAAILSQSDPQLAERLIEWRAAQTENVPTLPQPEQS